MAPGEHSKLKPNIATPAEPSDHPSLIHQPEIIAIIATLFVVIFVLVILTICFCRKRKSRGQSSERRCQCFQNYPHSHPHHGDYGHIPPPAYSPPEMHMRRPPYHHCSCQGMGDPGHSITRESAYRPQDQQPAPPGNAFPLLQQLPRSVANPVYDDADESTGVPRGPLKDLYKQTERSFSQTVCGKLLVSVSRAVDHRGDTLYLDNMGISLEVPPGAVKPGQTQLIALVLNWDLSDNPQMAKNQSLVSPVVYIGPHGLKLDKPCVLSYRHCAFDIRQIQVMRSETELTDRKSWEAVSDQADQSAGCYLTQDECRLTVEKFTLYTCLQSPLGDQVGKKWLQIAVFACPLRRDINHHQIRVYFLNKTPCALQWAIQNEAGFGGKLVCPEKVFLFDGHEFDMLVKTRYVSDGWELVDLENNEKISFLSIWHGQCPYISACYKRRPLTTLSQPRPRPRQADHAPAVAIELSLHLLTYQRSLEDSSEKIFIQVAEDNVTPVTDNELACRRHHVDNIEINVNNFRSPTDNFRSSAKRSSIDTAEEQKPDTLRVNINNMSCSVDFQQLAENAKPRILCHELRQKLVMLLDPVKHISGNDWRAFAEKLGYDSCIPKLESLGNPTENLLNIVESKNIPLGKLRDIFRDIKRLDCANTVDEYIQNGVSMSSSEREPEESSYSGYVGVPAPRPVGGHTSWDTGEGRGGANRLSWSVASSDDNNLSGRSQDSSSLFTRGFRRVDAERASAVTRLKEIDSRKDRPSQGHRAPEENSYNSQTTAAQASSVQQRSGYSDQHSGYRGGRHQWR